MYAAARTAQSCPPTSYLHEGEVQTEGSARFVLAHHPPWLSRGTVCDDGWNLAASKVRHAYTGRTLHVDDEGQHTPVVCVFRSTVKPSSKLSRCRHAVGPKMTKPCVPPVPLLTIYQVACRQLKLLSARVPTWSSTMLPGYAKQATSAIVLDDLT